jgi:HSP20 family protein
MSNVVRRNQENDPFLALTRDWLTPSRWRSLWEPFADLAPLSTNQVGSYVPEFDVKERPEGFVLRADLPGVRTEDLDVQANGNRITVSGKREEEKEEKDATTYRLERSYGSFTRSFTLPEAIDSSKINAELKNGVLTLNVPKKVVQPATSVKVKAV